MSTALSEIEQELDTLQGEVDRLIWENGKLNQRILRLKSLLERAGGDFIECGNCGARFHGEDVSNGCCHYREAVPVESKGPYRPTFHATKV